MLGVYKNLSNEEYHADTDSISRSAIMSYFESPYKYWACNLAEGRPENKQTPQMLFGEAFHAFILEPESFYDRFAVSPELMKLPQKVLLRDVGRKAFEDYKNEKSKIEIINKSITDAFNDKCDGMKVLTFDDLTKLKEMKQALQNNHDAWQLIDGAIYEQSYFWKDKESGLIVKARPDLLHQNMIIDLKTISNASPRYFQNAMVTGGYHIQGAMIRDGVRELEGRDIPNVINIAIEKEYPYCIGIYIIDEYALDHGREKYKQALLDIKHAREYNFYPDYNVQTVSLPKYAL